jgi:hypothetical protein
MDIKGYNVKIRCMIFNLAVISTTTTVETFILDIIAIILLTCKLECFFKCFCSASKIICLVVKC